MTDFKQINPIYSGREIQRVQALISEVVENPSDFSPQWIRGRSWTIVPVESCDHFGNLDIRLLSAAFFGMGHQTCLGVITEPIENAPICYQVPTTETALREFNEAVHNFFSILIPEDRSCAVLCTKSDYYLIAGPPTFVSMGVGGDIIGARTKFAQFAAKNPHPVMRGILKGIAEHYASNEPESAAE